MKITEENFVGPYKEPFGGYIKFKRAAGQSICQGVICKLNALSAFLTEIHPSTVCMTQADIEQFLLRTNGHKSSTRAGYESMIRQLGMYLRNCGYNDIHILPEGITKSGTDFVPYVFSENEIVRILRATDNLDWYRNKASTGLFYRVLVRLLYSTGLRIDEALGLHVSSVDLENRIITVHKSKGGTSRLVPYDESLHKWLMEYLTQVGRHDDNYFFRSPRNERYAVVTVQWMFKNKLLPAAGIVPAVGQRISLHSLRHTFACHSLNKMIENGKDSFCTLPYLSTYLGHVNIESSEIYLRLTKERFTGILDACVGTYEGRLSDEK